MERLQASSYSNIVYYHKGDRVAIRTRENGWYKLRLLVGEVEVYSNDTLLLSSAITLAKKFVSGELINSETGNE